MFSGVIRSIIECPFEYAKVRRQTNQAWKLVEIYRGFATLLPRSTLILTTYFLQVDLWQRKSNLMESKLGQFLVSGSAALFSYWLVWPLEVIKNVT